MKRTLPKWNKELKKALIDRDMTVTELAAELGISRVYASNIVNGVIRADAAPGIAARIGEYLEVPYPYMEVAN